MLTILYFAALRETLGLSQESLPLPEAATVADLIGLLRARGS
ncbi:MAG: molybdopterin synthase sulfur carrier subunit, partial [Betaproteobacteria bacterium]|nr:molybdopterin synthase sulfur carrier subunit [Betaproteobacteria bacterium]